MAFNGYLIKLGGSNGDILPMEMIQADSYSATPNQRMESEAKRATTGLLYRTTCSHTATKVVINTIPMTQLQWKPFWKKITDHFTNSLKRNITLYYYSNESDSYKSGDFYMPDIEFPINRIDKDNNMIYYNSIRLAFIEY